MVVAAGDFAFTPDTFFDDDVFIVFSLITTGVVVCPVDALPLCKYFFLLVIIYFSSPHSLILFYHLISFVVNSTKRFISEKLYATLFDTSQFASV